MRAPSREAARCAFDAAIAAVDARSATATWLRPRPIVGPVHVIALGKAALGMTAGALETCDVRAGVVFAPVGGRPETLPAALEILYGAHPIPDADVARRGAVLLDHAARIPEDATALVLLSGGGSALVDAPSDAITTEDLADITRRLLASGATIDELNAIRVALSRTKGGGLSRALRSSAVRVLVVSDIAPAGDPALVASGPMSAWRGPAPTDVIARAHVRAALTTRERAIVSRWRRRDTVDAKLDVIADNAGAVDAARSFLRERDRDVGDGPVLTGEASVCGRAWAEATRSTTHDALVSGGETIVRVRGDGRGGRSQELALAAALDRIGGVLLAAGTDGIDGPTDAAGAIIDDATRARLDPPAARSALERNDAYPMLASMDALLVTGPTGTNVADIAIWVR